MRKQIELAAGIRDVERRPRQTSLTADISFVKCDGHLSISEPPCSGFYDRSAMKVSQCFNFFSYPRDQLVYQSARPRFSAGAREALLIKILRNPLERLAVSIKFSGLVCQ